MLNDNHSIHSQGLSVPGRDLGTESELIHRILTLTHTEDFP